MKTTSTATSTAVPLYLIFASKSHIMYLQGTGLHLRYAVRRTIFLPQKEEPSRLLFCVSDFFQLVLSPAPSALGEPDLLQALRVEQDRAVALGADLPGDRLVPAAVYP